jgi:AbiU2
MSISEAEKQFEAYRHHLNYEATRLACYVAVYRRLYERRNDRLREMNLAPAFFSTVTNALLSAIILWTDKLFDEKGQRGIFDFLAFVESELGMLAIEQLKRRKNYPDGHWMLDRDIITLQRVNADRERIKSLDCLRSFAIRRDKFHAHFDKEYFFNRHRLEDEAPLVWGDFEKVIEVLSDIINHYSTAYDGNVFVLTPQNINDLDDLLNQLHRTMD